MTGIEIARATFTDAGLLFPTIPESLAVRLKRENSWTFSTRGVPQVPYIVNYYAEELKRTDLEDYVLLAHSGHGLNSHAIQYYVVYGAVRVLLHHGWGGIFMDPEETTLRTNECLERVNRILELADAHPWCDSLGPLTVVATEFYGSSYKLPGEPAVESGRDGLAPDVALDLAISWLEAH